MALKKKDIAAKVAESADLSKKKSAEIVDTVFAAIHDELAAGGEVDIHSFGKFTVKDRAARTGRNPRTNEAIAIPATKVPAFKASKNLKEAVK